MDMTPKLGKLDQFIAARVVNIWAAGVEDLNAKKLVMAIYKKVSTSDKGLRNGKHMIMLTGSAAKSYGVDPHTTLLLEDLSMDKLKKAAKAFGAL